jgi:hypothetical protein
MIGTVERLIKLMPGLVAGGLALIYILGAIVAGSEFEGTGVDARDAVPLLSLEQILARGIGVLVRPNALLAMLAIFLGLAALSPSLVRPSRPKLNRESNVRNSRSGFALLLGCLSIVGGFLMTPMNQLPGLLVTLLGFTLASAVLYAHGSDEWKYRRSASLVAALIALCLGLGVTAFTDPTPAAEVAVERTRDQPSARGVLITHSSATWYVFEDSGGQIRAYPDRSVKSATIFKRPSGNSNDGKTLAKYIWEGIPSILPF